MDSRLKYLAILGSAGIIVLVLMIALGTSGKLPQGTSNSTVQKTGAGTTGTEVADAEATLTEAEVDGLSDFLLDDSFFDKEENYILENAKDDTNRLSILTTSVEKDLRVWVLDHEGNPATGESFFIELTDSDGKKELYKDLDQDGMIYVGTLDSGEYEVALKPIAGYKVPTTTTLVKVKDKVEYIPIDDISRLILTEEDINPKEEDTAQGAAASDADDTEVVKLMPGGTHQKAGIDVSKWQKEIDWTKVKAAGVEFVIIRAGYRGSKTGSLVVDPYFEQNIKGAKKAGLEVGVYFFTQAVDEVEAVEEASAVLQLIKEYDLDLPVYIDTEGAGGKGRADSLDVETRTLVCEAFCRTVKNAGYQSGVYASRNWMNKKLRAADLDSYETWLAEYREAPMYTGYYTMWQYTSRGKIDGIEGNVDLDIYYY